MTLKSAGLLAVFAGLSLTPAFAVDITYNTTGTFSNCGVGFVCAGNTLTGPNGLSIVYTGETAGVTGEVSAPPVTYGEFGTFKVTGPTAGKTDTVSANFTLTVTQVTPAPGGTETLVTTGGGKFGGNIQRSSSQVTLTFASGSGDGGVATMSTDPLNGAAALQFTFTQPGHTNDVTYYVDKITPLRPQTSGMGISSINGAIDSTVPEPTFYALTGAGFLGLLMMAIRRRQQKPDMTA
jgi:hypothetical protein